MRMNQDKRKKQHFEWQLAAYSIMAAGFMAQSNEVEAQVLYTDLVEDIHKGDTSQYIFNINEDEYHDLLIFSAIHTNGKLVNIQLADSVEVLGSSYGLYFYPFALDLGYVIDGNNANWRDVDYGTMNWQSYNDYGNWIGVEDKFLAMKLIFNGKSYYGWGRMDIDENADSFFVKDYAFEFRPNVGIVTGEGYNSYGVTGLLATDMGNNSNATDMHIRFNKAKDESKVKEYRLILVNAMDTVQLTPNLAMNLLPDQYQKIDKTGNDFSFALASDAKDKNGESIKPGLYYKAYVLSVADGVNATDPILSTTQNFVILQTPSSPAGKPVVQDIADNNNGSDIQVDFSKAVDESKVKEYKVFIVKEAQAATFTVDVAKQCGPQKFVVVSKSGSDLTQVLDIALKDTDGDFIQEGISYKAFVLSVADGTVATQNILSEASDAFLLTHGMAVSEASEQVFRPYINTQVISLPKDFKIGQSRLQVMDMAGKVWINKELGEAEKEIPHNLAPGVYMIVLSSDDQKYVSKLVLNE
jgi:hypothetical protein